MCKNIRCVLLLMLSSGHNFIRLTLTYVFIWLDCLLINRMGVVCFGILLLLQFGEENQASGNCRFNNRHAYKLAKIHQLSNQCQLSVVVAKCKLLTLWIKITNHFQLNVFDQQHQLTVTFRLLYKKGSNTTFRQMTSETPLPSTKISFGYSIPLQLLNIFIHAHTLEAF